MRDAINIPMALLVVNREHAVNNKGRNRTSTLLDNAMIQTKQQQPMYFCICGTGGSCGTLLLLLDYYSSSLVQQQEQQQSDEANHDWFSSSCPANGRNSSKSSVVVDQDERVVVICSSPFATVTTPTASSNSSSSNVQRQLGPTISSTMNADERHKKTIAPLLLLKQNGCNSYYGKVKKNQQQQQELQFLRSISTTMTTNDTTTNTNHYYNNDNNSHRTHHDLFLDWMDKSWYNHERTLLLYRTVFWVNISHAILVVLGLVTILAAQWIHYDETLQRMINGNRNGNNDAEDDQLVVEDFDNDPWMQRMLILPGWLIPVYVVRVACALLGAYESHQATRTTMRRKLTWQQEQQEEEDHCDGEVMAATVDDEDDNRRHGIFWLGIAAVSFAYDVGLSVGVGRLDMALVSLCCLVPHVVLLLCRRQSRQLYKRHPLHQGNHIFLDAMPFRQRVRYQHEDV